MSFRLWMIFYAFALLAAAMATFGMWGIAATFVVAVFWGVIYPSRHEVSLVGCLVIISAIILIIALLLPAVHSVRALSRVTQCEYNLKNIAMALLNHESQHGTLPPASQKDSTALKNSWRVSILPELECADLYEKLDLSKSWDDRANQAVTSVGIMVFQCPNHGIGSTTDYFAIVGPQTAWPESGSRSIREIKDGPANTILLVEAGGRGVQWAEPRDLTFEEAVELLSQPPSENDGHLVENGFFYKPRIVRNVAFADGHVASINMPLDRELAAALLTVDGSEDIDLAAMDAATQPQLNYAKCYSLGLFVILSLLPVTWVWRRQGSSPHEG